MKKVLCFLERRPTHQEYMVLVAFAVSTNNVDV